MRHKIISFFCREIFLSFALFWASISFAQDPFAAAAVAPLDATFVSPLILPPSAVAAQADGKVIVAAPMNFSYPDGGTHYGLARLDQSGAVDPSFRPPATTPGPEGVIRRMRVEADGKIWVSAVSGATLVSWRLNPNGSLDQTAPAVDPLRPNAPDAPLANGRWIRIMLNLNQATFTRLTSAGAPDTSLAPYTVTLGSNPPQITGPDYRTAIYAVDAQQRVYVAFGSVSQGGTGRFFTNETTLLRFRPDGTRDMAFGVVIHPGGAQDIAIVGDHIYLMTFSVEGPLGSERTERLVRMRLDGSIDPTYAALEWFRFGAYPHATLLADGQALVVLHNPNTDRYSVSRYDPSGALDENFSLAFSLQFPPEQSARNENLLQAPDGAVYLHGYYSGINGVSRRFLARTLPDRQASSTRLTNFSVRQRAGTGDRTLIAGFVLAGAGEKRLLARGIGPTLSAFAVPQALADPRMSIYDGAGVERITNDDWSADGQGPAVSAASLEVGAFALPIGSADAASTLALSAGSHSIHVTGKNANDGVALAEAYDRDGAPMTYATARVINFSARAMAGAGADTLTAGFTISGPNVKRILIRAVGPSLSPFGIAGALADPRLEVHAGGQFLASNDNWEGAASLTAAFNASGAFNFSSSASKDAALIITLPPGGYTASVAGITGAEGVALIEVYELK